MTKIEAVKIQAKMLVEKSKKWCSLTCAKRPDCVWFSNGIIQTAVKPLTSAMGI